MTIDLRSRHEGLIDRTYSDHVMRYAIITRAVLIFVFNSNLKCHSKIIRISAQHVQYSSLV